MSRLSQLNSYVGIGYVGTNIPASRPARAIVEIQGERIECRIVGSSGIKASEGDLVGIRGRLTAGRRGAIVEASELQVITPRIARTA